MQNEEFKSKKQQRFFYAKANTQKGVGGEKWKKMADEFSADTDYSELDEKLLSELVDKVFEKYIDNSEETLIGEEKLMEKNEPTNPKLWSRAKAEAGKKFDKHSAYKMAWAAKWYKEKGGNWRKKKVNEYVEGMPKGENKVPFVKGAEKVEVKKDATVLGGKNYSQGDINALNITKYE